MGMDLDHCIHCGFSCLVLNMLHDCVLCDVSIIYMVKCIWKKRNTRVLKHNLRGSGKERTEKFGVLRSISGWPMRY